MNTKQTEYNLEKIKEIQKAKGSKLLIQYFRPYLLGFFIIFLILFASALSGLLIPMLARHAIDVNLAADPADTEGLFQTVQLIILLALIAVIGLYFQIRVTGRLGQTVLFKIRRDLFNKLQELPQRFYSVNKSGDIIARLTNDVEAISNFLAEGVIRLLGTFFVLSISSTLIFTIDYRLGLITLVIFLIAVVVLFFHGIILKNALRKSLDENAGVSNVIQEILNGFRVIKSYGQEKQMLGKFKTQNSRFFRFSMIANIINSLSEPFLSFAANLATLIIVLTALNYFITEESFLIGEVWSIVAYVGIFFGNFRNISDLWRNIQDGLASSQRIQEILTLESDLNEVAKPFTPNGEEVKGNIEFKNVTFGYDNNSLVLKDVSFKVNAGKTIAIVGPTGGGKTTFVNLIARLYDTTKGSVLVDGIDVKKWNLSDLRNSIGYLLQDTFLFDDTIFNNLRYANENVTKEESLKLLKKLGIEKFINELPKGIDTKLKDNGSNISVGQRQVLAIARLILREPKILILDEATSNVDTKTEELIQNAIEIATQNVTSFVIAHRLSTIKSADQIILIKDNAILESGSHESLMKLKGFYYEMYSKFVKSS